MGAAADLNEVLTWEEERIRREPFAGNLMHDATLTVDEKGTEAAAATRMYHIGGVPQVVAVNRPFLFLIRHVETAAVLFLGRVMDPRPPG
jgi:serpin B